MGAVGLCTSCVHGSVITSARGSTFYLCRLSFTDVRFAKYPTLPMLACAGYEIRKKPEEGPAEAADTTPTTARRYLLSLPERMVRSVFGLGAGVAREVGEVAIPRSVRQGQLYQNLVDATLRYLIEDVGGAEGVYRRDVGLPDDFLARRATGNAIEALGIVAFSASPVWVLAALSDVCGLGRHLIPEIAAALKTQGLLEPEAQFTTVDQMLDGLERTSSRMAATINTPPLNVAALRGELHDIREHARGLAPGSLPAAETIRDLWVQLKTESERQDRSVFETSSMMAVSAVRAVPHRLRQLSSMAGVGASRAGQVVGQALLEQYKETLVSIRHSGFAAYAGRQLRPYVVAAAGQFSPKRRTLTERLLERWRPRNGR